MNARRILGTLAVLCCLASKSSAAPAVAWKPAEAHRFAELTYPKSGKTGFSVMDPKATGIAFTNVLSEAKALENSLMTDGSGVAAGDIDGDGWCDLYFCR